MADQVPYNMPFMENDQLLRLHQQQALAEAMQKQGGDGGPVGSVYGAFNRAVSPLIGALLGRRADKQMSGLQDGAMSEMAALGHSDDPLAMLAASQNPLVRAMLPAILQRQLDSGFANRQHSTQYGSDKEADLKYDPLNTAAKYDAQRAHDPQLNSGLMSALAGSQAKAQSDAQLPNRLREIAAGQSVSAQSLAEQKRQFNLTHPDGSAAPIGGLSFNNPGK